MKIQASTKILAMVLAATSVVTPAIANAAPLFHLHPQTSESRISFVIYNQTYRDYSIRIAGRLYKVEQRRGLVVTAPVGTQIFAASDMRSAKNGSMLHEVTPADESHKIVLD